MSRKFTRVLAALALSGATLAAGGGTADAAVDAAVNALDYTVDGGEAKQIVDPETARCYRLDAPEGSQVVMRNNTEYRLAIYAGFDCRARFAVLPPKFGEASVRGLYSVGFFPR